MEMLPVIKGLATHVPFLYRAARGTTGGSNSARYCYTVWIRHPVHSVRGARPYLLNRRPLSAHLGYPASCGFVAAAIKRETREPTVKREALPQEFRGNTETDRSTASAAIVAIRAAAGGGVTDNEPQVQ